LAARKSNRIQVLALDLTNQQFLREQKKILLAEL